MLTHVLCCAAALTNFVHHGMIYVPPGYSYGPSMFGTDVAQVRSVMRLWAEGTPRGSRVLAAPPRAAPPHGLPLQESFTAGFWLALVAECAAHNVWHLSPRQ